MQSTRVVLPKRVAPFSRLTRGLHRKPPNFVARSQPGHGSRSTSVRSRSSFSWGPFWGQRTTEKRAQAVVPNALSTEVETATIVEGNVVANSPRVNEEGLPLVYDKQLMKTYWDSRPGEMQGRWTFFLSISVPYLSRLFREYTQGTLIQNEVELAGIARENMEQLGPTFIKMGQMMSIRPDVLSEGTRTELQKLQDGVKAFDAQTGFDVIEAEIGRPVDEIFSEISAEPIAAASLAQVYKARLRDTGETVAVKVQRPEALETVSRDLYVIERAAKLYQRIITQWTAQRTDYVELLDTWATGFYQELDFTNEAKNQQIFGELLKGMEGIYVPKVYMEYCSRRVLVSEWVDGVKLTEASPEDVRKLVKVGQECYLKQLLEIGYFHSDPHPGNLLKMSDTSKGQLCIIDFGLVAQIPEEDRDAMIKATIHLANKDFALLVDDFIDLGFLPVDIDRAKVEPLMERVLGPYVYQGGGAKAMLNRANFQELSRDMINATVEIPFAIPSYFSLIARAVATLEGIALTGDPDYRMVMEAYPYVARRLLRDDKASLQASLNEILYSKDGKFRPQRLSFLLNSALDNVASTTAFIDFDSIPEDSASLEKMLEYLLSDKGQAVREILVEELTSAIDLVMRQAGRRWASQMESLLRPPPPPIPVPSFLLPPNPFAFPPVKSAQSQFLDAVVPKLTTEEEVYVRSLFDLTFTLAGIDPKLVQDLQPDALVRVVSQRQGGDEALSEIQDFVRLLGSSSNEGDQLRSMGQHIVENVLQMYTKRLRGLLGDQR